MVDKASCCWLTTIICWSHSASSCVYNVKGVTQHVTWIHLHQLRSISTAAAADAAAVSTFSSFFNQPSCLVAVVSLAACYKREPSGVIGEGSVHEWHLVCWHRWEFGQNIEELCLHYCYDGWSWLIDWLSKGFISHWTQNGCSFHLVCWPVIGKQNIKKTPKVHNIDNTKPQKNETWS